MRSFSGTSLAVAALLTLSALPGCAKVGQLKALKSLKAANAAYKQRDYKAASDLYEETVQADPNQAVAYFYLANDQGSSTMAFRLSQIFPFSSILVICTCRRSPGLNRSIKRGRGSWEASLA